MKLTASQKYKQQDLLKRASAVLKELEELIDLQNELMSKLREIERENKLLEIEMRS